jgi:hypothetical protein
VGVATFQKLKNVLPQKFVASHDVPRPARSMMSHGGLLLPHALSLAARLRRKRLPMAGSNGKSSIVTGKPPIGKMS